MRQEVSAEQAGTRAGMNRLDLVASRVGDDVLQPRDALPEEVSEYAEVAFLEVLAGDVGIGLRQTIVNLTSANQGSLYNTRISAASPIFCSKQA